MGIPRFSERQLLSFILLATFLLHLPALFTYPNYVHDEVYFAEFAKNLAYGNGTIFDVHPYLQKDITAASILLFGNNPVGWRLPNMLAHVFLVWAVFLLAKELFQGDSRRHAQRRGGWQEKGKNFWFSFFPTIHNPLPLVAATLTATETMLFTLGTFAMIDIWAPLFIVLSWLFVLRLLRDVSGRNVLLAALSIGLAAASKWPAVPLAAIAALAFFSIARRYRPVKVAIIFLAIASLAYLASFIPMAARGNNPVIWHQQALNYHLTLNATHPYFSHPWTWPFNLRPVWFAYEGGEGWVKGVLAVGNIVVFWPLIPAALFTLVYSLWERRKHSLLFSWKQRTQKEKKWMVLLAASVLLFWLMFFPLRATTAYNIAPVLPLGIILITGLLGQLNRKWLTFGYVAAAVAFFLFFYPLLTGIVIPDWFYRWHIWLPGWI